MWNIFWVNLILISFERKQNTKNDIYSVYKILGCYKFYDVVSCPSFIQNVILNRYCFFEMVVADDDYDNDSFGDFNLMMTLDWIITCWLYGCKTW